MKTSVLKTLGVFTTFCQPVSSCPHVTPFLTDANSNVKGVRFENAGQVGPPQWSGSMIDNNFCRPRPTQAPINLHHDSLVYRPIDLGIEVDELVYGTMELPITTSVMEQLRFHTLSECSKNGEYSPMGSRAVFKASDGSVAAVDELTALDTTSSADKALSAVSYTADVSVAPPTDHLLFAPLMTHPTSSSAASPLLAPSCSEAVDWTTGAMLVGIMAVKKVKRFKGRCAQGMSEKHNLLFQGVKYE